MNKFIALTTLTTLSIFGIANTAQAGVMFRMNQGVSYGENGNMGIGTQVENTATVDFNDIIPNQKGQKSKANFSNDFASYSFESNNGRSAVIADQWVPENIDGSTNHSNPYLTVFNGSQVTIDLNDTANYFGLNWGSVSANNRIEFWNDDTLINTYQSAGSDIGQPVEGQAELNAAWQDVKGDHRATNFWNEADAYLEFWADDVDSLFNKIVLVQASSKGGGFETDNHSFLISDQAFDPDNNTPESVPEPGMVLGLMAIGGLMVKKATKKA